MKKHSWQTARFRRVTTAAALAFASLAVACDESTGPGGVVGVDVAILPIGTPTSNITRGSSVQLVAAPHDANDQFVNTTVTWSSSNTAIATVDADGTVTGVEGATAGGDVTITASAGGHSGTFDLNFQRPAGTVTIAPATAPTIRREGTTTFTATVLDIDGNPAGNRTINWSASSAGATVTASSVTNASGVATATVTGVSDGTVTITASAENNEVADVTATRDVIVSGAPLVATVTVTPTQPWQSVGGTIQLTQTSRSAANNTIPGTTAAWTTSAATVATVDGNGLVTIVGEGTATITATVDNGIGTNVTGTTQVRGATGLVDNVGAPASPNAEAAQYFTIAVPSGSTSLTVTTTGGTGDADLYVFSPTTTVGAVNTDPNAFAFSGSTCASASGGNAESCTINGPAAGNWKIAVFAWGPAGNVTGLTVTANYAP